MKANLTEISENLDKANKKSNKPSKQLPLSIAIIITISLMIFIPILFVGRNENKKNILLKNNFNQYFTNFYALNPFHKNNNNALISFINKNNFIEENKCISYDRDNNKCLKCSFGYKLLDGECVINYSFKAIYVTKKINENIKLINNIPNDITEMIIDGKEVKPCKNFTFKSKGQHIVYVLINISKVDSLNYMFNKINNLVSITLMKNLIQKK